MAWPACLCLRGQGITILNDELIMLTWREGTGLVYDPAIHSSKPSPAATPADSPADTEKEVAQTEQSADQSCGESESAGGGADQTGSRQNLGGKFTDAWVP